MANYRAFMAKLNKETESELIAWIEAQGSFTDLLRTLAQDAMAPKMQQQGPTAADILSAIDSLSTKIDNVSVVTSTPAGIQSDDDADGTAEAAGNLASWGL